METHKLTHLQTNTKAITSCVGIRIQWSLLSIHLLFLCRNASVRFQWFNALGNSLENIAFMDGKIKCLFDFRFVFFPYSAFRLLPTDQIRTVDVNKRCEIEKKRAAKACLYAKFARVAWSSSTLFRILRFYLIDVVVVVADISIAISIPCRLVSIGCLLVLSVRKFIAIEIINCIIWKTKKKVKTVKLISTHTHTHSCTRARKSGRPQGLCALCVSTVVVAVCAFDFGFEVKM